MSETDHPPVPPGCKLAELTAALALYGESKKRMITYYGISGRVIAAAVARCAWIDEARRIEAECWHRKRADTERGYAEAWRVWGERG